ncbi:MAG: protein kinase [Myxococcaceae bacterium]|nr:protein kinase [Myxococcaceae bacterium]
MTEAGCPSEAELFDAIEGRLADAEAARLNGHLEMCEACRDLIESLAEVSAVDDDPLLGAQLGEYIIEERIGQGGTGVVYRARQPLIGKQVAVKLPRGSLSRDEVAVKRLLVEAQAVNAIRHRGIIDIFSYGQLPDGRQYLVMEYLVGAPLDEYLRATRRLTPYQTLLILDEVLSALAAAHAAGVIHRDLKPSNLFMVSQPDGTKFVKVLDFGFSRLTKTKSEHTRHVMLGTPAYMAPELIRGGEVGPWTDLYAVGVLAWQLLVGRRPIEGSSVRTTLRQQLEAPVPAPSQFEKDVPAPLDAWVMALLTKDWRKRPQSTAGERKAVQRMLHALSTEKTERDDRLTLREGPSTGKTTEPAMPVVMPGGSTPTYIPPVKRETSGPTDPELPVSGGATSAAKTLQTDPELRRAGESPGLVEAVTRLVSRIRRN